MFGTCYLPGGREGPRKIPASDSGKTESPPTAIAALLRIAYLLFGMLLLAMIGTATPALAANEAFQNGRLRLGTGSEPSVNSLGNLQQPFYYDSVMGGGGWYQLTFSNYPLNNAVAVGGDGTSSWNLNGTLAEDPTLGNQVIDVSGFVRTSGDNGYGTIVSTGDVTIGAQTFQVRNTYILGATDSFVKIVTRVTNTGGTPLQNVRLWVGTQDDYVGGSDQPTKVRGNIINGVFTPLNLTSDPSPALQISSGATGVLFYSTSPRARTTIDGCCWFGNAYNRDPATNPITLTGDGSYALFIRMNDLAPGQSDEIDWYYAAGELANLGSIVAAVGSASSSGPVTLTRNVLASPFTPVTISGGTPPYSYAISPALPAGLSFNTSTGQITGTPTFTSTTTTYTVTITDAAPATTNGTFDMTVKDTQSIFFNIVSAQTYATSGTFSLTATATSGLTVSFASQTGSVCSVSGTTVTMLSTGTCTVRASQAGNGTYLAAPDVDQGVAIGQAGQTISFPGVGQQVFVNGGSFGVSASASSGLGVTFVSLSASICTTAGSIVTMHAPGTCTIRASQAGNSSFTAATPVDINILIGKLDQTVSFLAIAAQTYGPSATFSAFATSTSGLAVTITSDTTGVCTIAGSTVRVVTAGTCTLRGSQSGNATYNAAPDVTVGVNIAAASQTISFTAIAAQTYAPTATFGVSATASSGLPVSFTSSTMAVCTVAGTTVSILNAGTCTLVASQAGNGNYNAAADVNGSVTIAAAAQTINFPAIAAQTFVPSATFTVSATASSGLTVAFASSTPAVCTVAGNTVSVVSAGTCTLVASQAGNGNYNAAANANGSVSIAAASQTITFPVVATQTFAPGATLNVSATASSGLAVSFVSDSPAVCSVSGNVVTLLAAGSCGIRATQAGNGNYNAAADVRNTFTVDKSAQTITFSQITAQTFAPSGGFSVAASTNSGLVVSFASDTPAVCSVSGTAVSILTAGTCTLRASQAGNGNYNPAADVTASVVIAQSAQTITFGALPGQPLAGTPLQVSASSSSGLAVVFSSQSPSVCSVSGATVTMLSLGTCTVRASQTGDINYLAAVPVDRSFTVSQAVSQLALSSSNSRATYGKAVTLTLMVRGFSPTGRVDFMISGAGGFTQICNAVVLTNGLATCDVPGSLLRANPVIFVASYNGDTNNQANSANYQQTVDVGQASVSVTVNPQVPVAGRSVTLSAMITQARLDSRLAFMENGVAVPGCSAVPVAAFGGTGDLGGAQCVIPSITAGVHTYVVTYPNASGTGFDQVYVMFEVTSVGPQDYSGMWWAGQAENGWGLSVDQHGGKQFVLLYVYDGNGKPVFYAMPTGNWNDAMTSFSGQLFLPTGTSFSNYDASKFSANAPVGSATITYTSDSTATLTYTINGISGTKQITRELFSDGVNINVSVGDMWWGGNEQNGWGMNISHQGSVLFPVWYTYDEAGKATWYTMPGGRWNGATYTGDLYYSTSSAWLGVPYDVRLFAPTKVGQISIAFIDENTATVTFNVNGVVRTGTISRQPY